MSEDKRRTPLTLTNGSVLIVRSADKGESPLISQGTFRGYVSLGGDQAISMELDEEAGNGNKGRIRFIPCATLLSVDIVTHAKAEEEKKAQENRPVYFG